VKVSVLFHGYRLFKPGRVIAFQGRTYPFLYARYNLTVRNERAIELPIFWDAVQRQRPEQVLEVGNVLAHYFPIKHTVVDKYERGPRVINEDVVDYRPGRTFDLIVAISTLEHVGWDEEPRDPPKIRRAIETLRGLLSPQGRLVISLPLGYNTEVDRLVRERALPFTTAGYLKRVTADNQWREVDWEGVQGAEYNYRIPTANAVVLGTIEGAAPR
jgi:SAM-dependent methyltransferase